VVCLLSLSKRLMSQNEKVSVISTNLPRGTNKNIQMKK